MSYLLKIYNSLSKILFLISLMGGSMISISSTTWLGACMGLELNLMMFIPLLSDQSTLSTETSLKYFLVQACASLLVIFSAVSLIYKNMEFFHVISISLFLKMGVAPFHFCYPMVAEGLNWMLFYLLASVQKLAPMVLIFYSFTGLIQPIFLAVVALSSAVGAIGGINEFSLRKLMAYSSINHMSWILLPLMKNLYSWVVYFFFYCLIIFSIIYLLSLYGLYHCNQVLSYKLPMFSVITFISGLISLGGLPPMMGFAPKWIVLQSITSSLNIFLILLLIVANIITLFYYTRILVMLVFILKWSKEVNKSHMSTFLVPFWFTFNSGGLAITYLLYIM